MPVGLVRNTIIERSTSSAEKEVIRKLTPPIEGQGQFLQLLRLSASLVPLQQAVREELEAAYATLAPQEIGTMTHVNLIGTCDKIS